jgi:hypothetical protein
MTKLKIILFATGLLLTIGRSIRKYVFKNQILTIYDFLLVFLFLWLLIKNVQKL